MIERLLLTPDFVNQASPPVRGERWIADAKLRGFGLRLWQTKQGEGKAYAVRTVGKRGRSIRRTYDGEARNELSPVTGERRSLGDVLEEAREWAADEICRAKGKPTLRQEKDEHRRRFSRRISRLTLDDLARARIRGMLVRGLTESYIDRLTKLYHQYVALKLRQTRISKLKPRALAKTFQALNEKPGSARTLRSFLGQVVKDASFYCCHFFEPSISTDSLQTPARNTHTRSKTGILRKFSRRYLQSLTGSKLIGFKHSSSDYCSNSKILLIA